MKRMLRDVSFRLLGMIPILLASFCGWFWYHTHVQDLKFEANNRALEISEYEFKRMVAMLNYRMNLMREELIELYKEQANLRHLSEEKREDLLFQRRSHLLSFAILVQNSALNWEVQKYYFPKNDLDSKKRLEVVQVFDDTAGLLKSSPFSIQQFLDWYSIAFPFTDEFNRSVALVGLFKPDYVFSFCKYFGDTFGKMPTQTYVITEQGQLICSSKTMQSHPEGLPMFASISSVGESGGVVRYMNAFDLPATARVLKIQPANLYLVSEATEENPFSIKSIPLHIYIIFGVSALLSLLVTLFLLKQRPVAASKARVEKNKSEPTAGVSTAGVSTVGEPFDIELSQFTKLRSEIKELENTVLELQSDQAFTAQFQQMVMSTDAIGICFVEYLSVWQLPIAWLPVSGKTLVMGAFANWPSLQKLGRPLGLYNFCVDLPDLSDANSLVEQEALKKNLISNMGCENIFTHPIYFKNSLLGLVVIGEDQKSLGAKRDLLVQISQIFALALRTSS